MKLHYPTTQLQKVLYELLVRDKITQSELVTKYFISNVTARINDLRNDYGIDVRCENKTIKNKFKRSVNIGLYYIPKDEKVDAEIKYQEMIKKSKMIKLTESQRIEVARDYHFSDLNNKEIADKYNISPGYASKLGHIYSKSFLDRLDDDKESVIIVRSKDLLLAQLILEQEGIKIIKPDNVIIEQHYNSKL